jgi:hypothetical protein
MTYPFTTFNELRDTILTWCNDVTARDIVLANAGEGPKPGTPYIELTISAHDTPTSQTESLSEDGEVETVYAMSSVTAQLNFFGGNAMQDASRLIRSLKSGRRFLDLWKICGLGKVQNLRDLTFLETASRKQRAEVEILFYCVLSDEFVGEYADSVPITLVADNNTVVTDLPGGENPRQKSNICPT